VVTSGNGLRAAIPPAQAFEPQHGRISFTASATDADLPANTLTFSLMLAVDDTDRVRDRAMAAGATGDRPPYDAYGHRNAWIVDPFGHRWGLSSPLPEPTAG